MERAIGGMRTAAPAILTFATPGIALTWLLLGGAMDRSAEATFTRALGETRRLAIESGRTHLLAIAPPGASATLEIRDGDRVLRGISIADASVHQGPDWIRLLPTGEATLPPGFRAGARPDLQFDSPHSGSNSPISGDVVFTLSSGSRHVALMLDLPSGRVAQVARLVDEPSPAWTWLPR